MEQEKSRLAGLAKTADVFFESLTFTLLNYILLCWAVSFKRSVLYILLIPLIAVVMGIFLQRLKGMFKKKWPGYILFALCILAVGALFVFWGLYPVGTQPVRLLP